MSRHWNCLRFVCKFPNISNCHWLDLFEGYFDQSPFLSFLLCWDSPQPWTSVEVLHHSLSSSGLRYHLMCLGHPFFCLLLFTISCMRGLFWNMNFVTFHHHLLQRSILCVHWHCSRSILQVSKLVEPLLARPFLLQLLHLSSFLLRLFSRSHCVITLWSNMLSGPKGPLSWFCCPYLNINNQVSKLAWL